MTSPEKTLVYQGETSRGDTERSPHGPVGVTSFSSWHFHSSSPLTSLVATCIFKLNAFPGGFPVRASVFSFLECHCVKYTSEFSLQFLRERRGLCWPLCSRCRASLFPVRIVCACDGERRRARRLEIIHRYHRSIFNPDGLTDRWAVIQTEAHTTTVSAGSHCTASKLLVASPSAGPLVQVKPAATDSHLHSQMSRTTLSIKFFFL